MSINEDIVIVGAGIAGLTTALGLHRMGVRCLVLESSESLRATGYALTMWTNAWRALDALGVGDLVRKNYLQLQGYGVASSNSDLPSSEKSSPKSDDKFDKFEIRCVRRKELLETLETELPKGTIRFSSKLVSIEELGKFKLVHLADGTIVQTKVLIGCDGVNSMVAKWLGLQNLIDTGRSSIRGFVTYPNAHGLEPKFHVYVGGGVRYGFIPCDEKSLYWACTFTNSVFNYDVNEKSPLYMKQFVASKIQNAPIEVSDVVERTDLDAISCAPLKFRSPFNILLGSIVKNNVCVAGDAFHPMTPDIGQGGCSALEDGVVLARCLGQAISAKENDEYVKMEIGLKEYVKERRWRSFKLVSMAYLVGLTQQSDGKMISFLRKNFLNKYTIEATWRTQHFDCGKLIRP